MFRKGHVPSPGGRFASNPTLVLSQPCWAGIKPETFTDPPRPAAGLRPGRRTGPCAPWVYRVFGSGEKPTSLHHTKLTARRHRHRHPVKGHEELPSDGHGNCPVVATRSARSWPPGLAGQVKACTPCRPSPGIAGRCHRWFGRGGRGAGSRKHAGSPILGGGNRGTCTCSSILRSSVV